MVRKEYGLKLNKKTKFKVGMCYSLRMIILGLAAALRNTLACPTELKFHNLKFRLRQTLQAIRNDS